MEKERLKAEPNIEARSLLATQLLQYEQTRFGGVRSSVVAILNRAISTESITAVN